MKERLVIKNFGPIKEVDLTFGRFNVLIGEQATGKSTVLKVLAMCRYFSYLTGIAFKKADPFTGSFWDWGIMSFRQQNLQKEEGNSYIEYECEDYNLKYSPVVTQPKENKDVRYSIAPGQYIHSFILKSKSERFERLLSELDELQKENKGIPYTFFRTSVAQVMRNPLFLGTERDSDLLGFTTSNLQGPIENVQKLRQIRERFYEEVEIEPLSIVYKFSSSDSFIKKKEEESFYKLSESASGYQSAVPIVLAIKNYTNPPEADGQPSHKEKTFIIEEPELNLFPTTQYELMKFLVDKTINYGNQMFIATHSPYILAALNNMLNAYKSGQIDEERTNTIMPKKYWLNADEVMAYRLVQTEEGTIQKDLMNRELSMIHSEEIDEVSRDVNQVFDGLVTIQLEQEDE